MNSFEDKESNMKDESHEKKGDSQEKPVESSAENRIDSGLNKDKEKRQAEKDALNIRDIRGKIRTTEDGREIGVKDVVEEFRSEYAAGYSKEDGSPLTMEEFRKVSDEFKGKLMTKFKVKFGIWSDFDQRRELDKYFLEKDYRVSRRRGNAIEE